MNKKSSAEEHATIAANLLNKISSDLKNFTRDQLISTLKKEHCPYAEIVVSTLVNRLFIVKSNKYYNFVNCSPFVSAYFVEEIKGMQNTFKKYYKEKKPKEESLPNNVQVNSSPKEIVITVDKVTIKISF